MKRPSLGTLLGAAALVIAVGSTGVAADAASLITGKDIKDGSVTGVSIQDGSLTGADIQDRSLTGRQIRSSSVGGRQIRNRSLTGADVKNGSLTRADLAPGTIPSAVAGASGAPGKDGTPGAPGKDGAAIATHVRSIAPVSTTGSTPVPLSGGSFSQGPDETLLPMTVTAVMSQWTCPAGAVPNFAPHVDLQIDGTTVATVYVGSNGVADAAVPGFNSTGATVQHQVTATLHGTTCIDPATYTPVPATATLASLSLDVARAS